jgi:hypothetical protein
MRSCCRSRWRWRRPAAPPSPRKIVPKLTVVDRRRVVEDRRRQLEGVRLEIAALAGALPPFFTLRVPALACRRK